MSRTNVRKLVFYAHQHHLEVPYRISATMTVQVRRVFVHTGLANQMLMLVSGGAGKAKQLRNGNQPAVGPSTKKLII